MTITIEGHELTAAERSVYERAADKSRTAYVRKHGGPAVDVSEYRTVHEGIAPAEWKSDAARVAAAELVHCTAAEWRSEHLEPREASARRAGETAVRKRLRELAEVFGDVDAAARLEVLAPVRKSRKAPVTVKATRPAVARKTSAAPVPVPAVETVPECGAVSPDARSLACTATPGHRGDHIHESDMGNVAHRWPAESPAVCYSVAPCGKCEGCQRIAALPAWTPEESAPVPDRVPAPMPRMTRAARRVSNRELAGRMRAAGVAVTAESWAAAKAGELEGIGA